MKNDKPLYIVKPRYNTSLDEIYAMFDSKTKLEEFIMRFKTRQKNMEVIIRTINPTFYTDKTSDPYYLAFDKITSLPKEIFLCYSPHMTEEAKLESYSISFYPGNDEQEGIFIYQCFANDEKEAINKAIIKRDALIINGDWERAWINYNLKKIKAAKK